MGKKMKQKFILFLFSGINACKSKNRTKNEIQNDEPIILIEQDLDEPLPINIPLYQPVGNDECSIEDILNRNLRRSTAYTSCELAAASCFQLDDCDFIIGHTNEKDETLYEIGKSTDRIEGVCDSNYVPQAFWEINASNLSQSEEVNMSYFEQFCLMDKSTRHRRDAFQKQNTNTFGTPTINQQRSRNYQSDSARRSQTRQISRNSIPEYGLTGGAHCSYENDKMHIRHSIAYFDCETAILNCQQFRDCNFIISFKVNGLTLFELGDIQNSNRCPQRWTPTSFKSKELFGRDKHPDICSSLTLDDEISNDYSGDFPMDQPATLDKNGPHNKIIGQGRELTPRMNQQNSKPRLNEQVYGSKQRQRSVVSRNSIPVYNAIGSTQCAYRRDTGHVRHSIGYTSWGNAASDCTKFDCDIIVSFNTPAGSHYEIGHTRKGRFCQASQTLPYDFKVFPMDWEVTSGDCWYDCGNKPGSCNQCKNGGYCCSKAKFNLNGNCPRNAVQEMKHLTQGRGHQCIAKAVKKQNQRYPKRARRFAERIGYKCADLGGSCNATSSACSQLFDSFKNAQLACSVSKDCSSIGSSNGKFQILKKDDEDHCNNINFEKVETNEVKIDVSEESFFQFTSIINHEAFLTQIIQYDQDKTIYHVPKHAQLSEARITIFHDLNLQASRLEQFCVLQRNFEETKKITKHSASMMDYKKEKSEGTLVRSDRKTSLKPVTVERIPKFVIDACGHLPIYQVEIDELKPDSLKNITMEKYKMDETTDVENLFSLSRSTREPKECPKKYCKLDMVSIQCGQTDCDSGWCYFRPTNVLNARMDAWDHIYTMNYWCLPCCIMEARVPAMKVCSTMPTSHDICRTYEKCKRCGDSGFNANRSC